jgi:cardiolipin synthase
VRIEGPLVAKVGAEARKLWARVSWATLGGRWRQWPGVAMLMRTRRSAAVSPPGAPAGTQSAALVVRDSLRHRQDIEKAYIELIEASRREIIVACAYFFPTRRFRHALLRAARRHVTVSLLMQGKTDHPLLYYASRALYRSFLGAGIRIYEYYRSELHAKVAVIDGRFATVGSSNIDPFSFGLAREANIFVDDPQFAGELRADLHDVIERQARHVPADYWRRLDLWLKLRIRLAYRVARLVLSIYRFESLR